MNQLPRTLDVLRRGIDDGSHAGAQLYVSIAGETVAEIAVGEAAPGVAMTVDTVIPWMSSGKPITAAAALRLNERGAFGLDDPVTDHLPEFTGGGKEAITIRHLLTHTAGLHGIRNEWPIDEWDDVLAKLYAADLPDDWTPGERAAYDPANGWFVLGELVARWHGGSYGEAIRELVLAPCELVDTFCGADDATFARLEDRLGVLYERTRGELQSKSVYVDRRLVGSPSPGGNFRGPVRELGRFHERLPTLLGPETFAAMTARQRTGLHDETFQHRLDFGLGVIVDSNRYGAETVPYGFGPHCSQRTYGHGGVQSSIGFRDPDRDLVVAWVANGRIGEPRHQRRNRAINTAIHADLFDV